MIYDEIISLVDYDESSPSCLRWNVDRWCGNNHNRRGVCKGDVAGHLESNGYWRIALGNRKVAIHRLVFYKHHRFLPTIVDHIDGNSSNNKINNLRESSHSSNQRNRKISVRNISGKSGVSLYKKVISGIEYLYWRATWRDLDGNAHEKYFRVSENSDDALTKAIAHREDVINQLNNEGAGYTERHNIQIMRHKEDL